MRPRPWRADLLHTVHVVHGGALLVHPLAVARRVDPAPDRRAVATVRVLGARHLLQGIAGLVTAPRPTARLGAGIDGIHAASMVGLALVDRRRRRGALLSTVVALAFAFAGSWAARHG